MNTIQDQRNVGKYLKQAFVAIQLGGNYHSLNYVLSKYSEILNCSPATLRNAMVDKQRLTEMGILRIARDAVLIGYLNESWLKEFLGAANVNDPTIEKLSAELFAK